MYKPPDSTLALWGVILGVVAAFVYFMQWRAMDQAMKIDQRAWVHLRLTERDPVSKIPDFNPIRLPLAISNTGKTPAKKVSASITATVRTTGEVPDFNGNIGSNSEAGIGILMPNTNFPFETAITIGPDMPHSHDLIMLPNLRTALNEGKAFIEVHGQITYDDVFKYPHWAHFCIFITGGESDPTTARAGEAPKKCAEANRIDETDE